VVAEDVFVGVFGVETLCVAERARVEFGQKLGEKSKPAEMVASGKRGGLGRGGGW
jgi:hypothetical protein